MGLEDKLDELFKIQKELQEAYGKNIPFKNEKERQAYINENGLALYIELGEAIKKTPFKSWKKNQEFNKEKFKEEIIDCMHFLINLALSIDMTSNDFYEKYKEKNQVNRQRIKNGY